MKQVEEQCKYWINNVPPNAPSGCIPAPRECEACKRFSKFEPMPIKASAKALREKKYKPEEPNDRLLTREEMAKALENARLSPYANPYQERCVIAKAQRDLTASIKEA